MKSKDLFLVTKSLKTMLNRKNRLFSNYKRHGYKAEDNVRHDAFRNECQQTVETAKLSYLIFNAFFFLASMWD